MSEPPAPRRMTRPKWLNGRVVGGVLLVVVAVAVGAKVIGSASRTSPVWAASHDLAAGTVLQSGDLTVAEVNLGDRGGSYVNAASEMTGRALNRPLTAGELLPAAAVGKLGDGRIVSIAVAPDHMAPGIAHGSVIDLYLTTGRSSAGGGEVDTRMIQRGVTVQSVTAPASGGLSGAVSNEYRIALRLAPADADALVKQLPLGKAVVVRHTNKGADSAGG